MGMIEHHLSPDVAFANWQRADAKLPDISWINDTGMIVTHDKSEMARYQHYSDIQTLSLGEDEVDALLAFLNTLTGESVENTPLGIPSSVPSGLAVDK